MQRHYTIYILCSCHVIVLNSVVRGILHHLRKFLYDGMILNCIVAWLYIAEQKLKSLNTVRDALNVMDSLRTRDLLDVMDRQIYLFSRGRRFSTELKNRTLHLFVHYMEDELDIKRKIP